MGKEQRRRAEYRQALRRRLGNGRVGRLGFRRCSTPPDMAAAASYYGPRKLGRFVKRSCRSRPSGCSAGCRFVRPSPIPPCSPTSRSWFSSASKTLRPWRRPSESTTCFQEFAHRVRRRRHREKHALARQARYPLAGHEIARPQGKFHVAEAIAGFVNARLVKCDEARDWTWKERKYPTE